MAFSGDGQKLIGNDGTVFDATVGTEVEGDGIAALPEGYNMITGVAPSGSGWPATSGATGATQVGLGRIIQVRAGDTAITPAAGDFYVPLTLTELCDLGSWTLQFTSDEVEITGFCDDFKTYRAGKDDVQGGLTGVFRIGTTDKKDGLAITRTFIDIVEQDGGDTVDVYDKLKGAKIVQLVKNKEGRTGDFYDIFAGVELFGYNDGAEQGANAQTFDSSFRFSGFFAGAASVELLPTMYRRARGA
jgi:hypothetical protein